MRCRLGPRLLRRIERITKRSVVAATVRGGERHFWACVVFADNTIADVNYKTGAFDSSNYVKYQHLYAQRAAEPPE